MQYKYDAEFGDLINTENGQIIAVLQEIAFVSKAEKDAFGERLVRLLNEESEQ